MFKHNFDLFPGLGFYSKVHLSKSVSLLSVCVTARVYSGCCCSSDKRCYASTAWVKHTLLNEKNIRFLRPQDVAVTTADLIQQVQ